MYREKQGGQHDKLRLHIFSNHSFIESLVCQLGSLRDLELKDSTSIPIESSSPRVTDVVLTIISGFKPQPITPNLEETQSLSSSPKLSNVKCEINCLDLGSIFSSVSDTICIFLKASSSTSFNLFRQQGLNIVNIDSRASGKGIKD